MSTSIPKMIPADWPAASAIYLEGIRTGNAIFQIEAPSWEDWDKAHLPICRLLAVIEGKVASWAARLTGAFKLLYFCTLS